MKKNILVLSTLFLLIASLSFANAITIKSPEDKSYLVNKDILLEVKDNEVTRWEYSLDGNEKVSFNGKKTLKNLKIGKHTIIVYGYGDGFERTKSIDFSVRSRSKNNGDSNLLGNLDAGEHFITFNITDNNKHLSGIDFKLKESAYNVVINILEKNSNPSMVDTNGTPFTYYKLKSSVYDSSLESVKIKFFVPSSWIQENKFSEKNIVLKRYSEGKWNDLKTSFVSKDGANYNFVSESPGFSYFAIVGDKDETPDKEPEVIQNETKVNETEEDLPEPVPGKNSGSIGMFIFGIFALISIGLVIWFIVYISKNK
jgi:PGF-pre-PGF domain-containing protein